MYVSVGNQLLFLHVKKKSLHKNKLQFLLLYKNEIPI